MADIDTLLPDRNIDVAGETITVRPYKFAQLPQASAIVAKYMNKFQAGEQPDLVALLTEGGEDIFKLMCLAINKDRKWLDTLEAEDGINLLSVVIEVNYDFFTRKLTPLLTSRMEVISQLVGQK